MGLAVKRMTVDKYAVVTPIEVAPVPAQNAPQLSSVRSLVIGPAITTDFVSARHHGRVLIALPPLYLPPQDASLLPFSEFLDWTEFALLVPERSTEAIPHMVRSMSPAKIRRMQAHGREVFLRYFRDEETMVLTLVEVIKARMRQVAATRQAGRGPGAGR
jgi:hypothetical protein